LAAVLNNGPSEVQGINRALVVALSEYNNLKPLDFCKNDGEKMLSLLKKLNYDIPETREIIGDTHSESLKFTIHDFFINQYNRAEDTLLFYFSGHGVMDSEGDLYLAPTDMDPDAPLRKGFPFYYITKLMNMCVSTSVITILDCCFSGAAKLKGDEDAESKQSISEITRKSNRLKQGQGKCLLAASQGYQEAVNLKEENLSLYTYYLLQGLSGIAKNELGNVTVSTLSSYVYNGVTNPINGLKQQPISKFELSGDIILARYPTILTVLREMKVTEFNILKMNVYLQLQNSLCNHCK
jgi:Caspase domain